MIKVLFLDDERTPGVVNWVKYPKGSVFTVVRSYNEFLEAVRLNDKFDVWSLDHDLGINGLSQEINLSGYDSLKAALRWYPDQAPKQVIAHSKNPIGAENINKYWENYVSNWN